MEFTKDEILVLRYVHSRHECGDFCVQLNEILNHFYPTISYCDCEDLVFNLQDAKALSRNPVDRRSSISVEPLGIHAIYLWKDRENQIQQKMATEVRNRKNDRKHDVVLLLISTLLAFLLDQLPQLLAFILQ